MLKKSNNPGKSTLPFVEIQHISPLGIWILIGEREFFLAFTEFPWFRKATIDQIYDLEVYQEKHLHWPELDVDIDLESLKHPDAYPLKYK